jgi:hypothetical protein
MISRIMMTNIARQPTTAVEANTAPSMERASLVNFFTVTIQDESEAKKGRGIKRSRPGFGKAVQALRLKISLRRI